MTWLCRRLTSVRRDEDEGSVLVLALVFLMVFGSWLGIVLQFAAAGQRTTVSVRAEASSTYAGGGALDGAINAVRSTLSVGTQATGAATCFTLPVGALDNATAVTVTCDPRAGSGGPLGSASQPAQSVLALSSDATEGVSVAAAAVLPTQGDVLANKRISVPAGATLTSTGSVRALTCSTAGTVTPACTVAAAGTATDPGWTDPTVYPSMGRTVPACTAQARLVTLVPGTYLSGSVLQAALNCVNRVIWFTPGTYYLDFRDTVAANRELRLPSAAVVVGGTPLGWTPNTTLPTAVPVPTAANPTRSACDVGAQGVQFVFAGDSRMNVLSGADMQLCAEETSSVDQHVVIRGLASQTAALPAAQPTTGGATVSALAGTGATWTNPADGAVIDGNIAFATAARNTTTRALRVGPFPTGLVPPEATNIAVTVSVTGGMVGPGATNVRLTDGTTLLTSTPLRTCPVAGCNDTVVRTDNVTITGGGLTAALANSMYVDVLVSSRDVATPNGGATTGAVDGITVSVNFSAPMRPTSGTGTASPYVAGSASTTPILRSAGPSTTTVLALHGTVDAQLAAVDLGVTGLPYTVIDRGVVVRHLSSAMTAAAGYSGAMISVPALGQTERRVVLTAIDSGGATLARADVTFANAGGTVNGTVPTVNEWTVG